MKVFFVGAGPGDPELLTLKAKKVIQKAGVVIYTGSLVNPDLLEFAPRAEVHNSAEMEREQIYSIMEEAVAKNETVVRLHTGDPSLYGALQEQIDYLAEKEIDYEIIPGVSSLQAAAAAVDRELTLPGVAQTVIITRQEGRTPVPEDEKIADLAEHNSSMAIFLSVGMLKKVVRELRKGYTPETPVTVVYKASWPEEEIIEGNLNNIVARVKEAGITKTALILVGDFLKANYDQSRLYEKDFSHGYRGETKNALLVASFGTTYPGTRCKTIAACEKKLAETYSGFDIKRTFTSQMVIDKLKERDGLEIENPREALQKLQKEGYSQVIIQSLHIIPGQEYHKLVRIKEEFEHRFKFLKVGEPLFYRQEDYHQVARVLQKMIPELTDREAVLFMGHGSAHPANAAYSCLEHVFQQEKPGQIFVGTVEGYPTLKEIVPRLKRKDINKVYLYPLMLVAGDHAQNDMAGDRKGSWENMLKSEGLEVETELVGLGEIPGIQKIYRQKVRRLVSE